MKIWTHLRKSSRTDVGGLRLQLFLGAVGGRRLVGGGTAVPPQLQAQLEHRLFVLQHQNWENALRVKNFFFHMSNLNLGTTASKNFNT